jgi:hypothetical protein
MKLFWQKGFGALTFFLLFVTILIAFGDSFKIELYVFPDGKQRSPSVLTSDLIPAGCSQLPQNPADVSCPNAPIKADADYRLVISGANGNVNLILKNESTGTTYTLGSVTAPTQFEGTFATSTNFKETDLWSIQAKQGSNVSNKIYFYVLSTSTINVGGQTVDLCNLNRLEYQCYLGFCYKCPIGVDVRLNPRSCTVRPPDECKNAINSYCTPAPIRER